MDALQKRGALGATPAELTAATGIPPRTVTHALRALSDLKRIDRLGYRHVRAKNFGDQPPRHLTTDGGRRIWETLQDADLPAYLTGLDVLAPYAQHFINRFPHIVIVDRETGPMVGYALIEAGFTVLPPGTTALTPDADTTVIVRDLASWRRYGVRTHLAPAELAWVDLYREVRVGYPFAPTELGRLLRAILNQGGNRHRLETISRDHFAADIRAILNNGGGAGLTKRVATGFRA